MVISDQHIKERIADGRLENPLGLKFSPAIEDYQFGGADIDLRLGNDFKIFTDQVENYYLSSPIVRVYQENYEQDLENLIENRHVSDDEEIIIDPYSMVLGITQEMVTIPEDVFGVLDGRSRLGRVGISVHTTACGIKPGYHGKIVLEIFNHGIFRVALKPGMMVCSLRFHQVSSIVDRVYGDRKTDRYTHQDRDFQI